MANRLLPSPLALFVSGLLFCSDLFIPSLTAHFFLLFILNVWLVLSISRLRAQAFDHQRSRFYICHATLPPFLIFALWVVDQAVAMLCKLTQIQMDEAPLHSPIVRK